MDKIKSTHHSQALIKLRKQWAGYSLLSGLILGISHWGIKILWGNKEANQWLAITGVMLIYLLWTFLGLLEQNHREGDTELLETIGAGNSLTIMRGVLVAMIAGFLFLPRPSGYLSWAPALLYIISDIADFADGILARKANHATKMGESLDVFLDGLGLFLVTLLAFQYGTVPIWYLLVGIARYLFIIGINFRKARNKTIYNLEPSVFRRGMAGLQIGFVTVMIFPVVSPPATTFAATLFMIPFLGGFIYDWLSVSGGRKSPTQKIQNQREELQGVLRDWIPLILRVILAMIFVHRLIIGVNKASITAEGYRLVEIADPELFLTMYVFLEGLFLVTLTLGAAGRVIAVIALISMGVRLQYDLFNIEYAILLTSLMGILFLGTGKYSLWQPMEELIRTRIGE